MKVSRLHLECFKAALDLFLHRSLRTFTHRGERADAPRAGSGGSQVQPPAGTDSTRPPPPPPAACRLCESALTPCSVLAAAGR